MAGRLDQGDIALIGHAHGLRVLGTHRIGLHLSAGGKLRLDTRVLGHEHGRRVILRWNRPTPPPPATAAPGGRH